MASKVRYDSIRQAIQDRMEATGHNPRSLSLLVPDVSDDAIRKFLAGAEMRSNNLDRLFVALGLRVVAR